LWAALLFSSNIVATGVTTDVAEVSIKKFLYHPAEITIQVGERVRWVNEERRQYHSVQLHRDGSEDEILDSGYLFPGDQWEHRFDKPGNYSYLCGPHPEMVGNIIVTKK